MKWGKKQLIVDENGQSLEFYNPDKGRKTLNLTEKYKKQSAGSKENKKSKPSGKRENKMLYQVIGVERKTGDFTPRDGSNLQIHYDNIVFHCVTLKRLVGCAGRRNSAPSRSLTLPICSARSAQWMTFPRSLATSLTLKSAMAKSRVGSL